jgi:hypothetical protein
MAIDLNNINVLNVNDDISAINVILISLQRYYIKSYNLNTIVPTEQFPLSCKTTNNLSRYNDMYRTIKNMVLPLWPSVVQSLPAC